MDFTILVIRITTLPAQWILLDFVTLSRRWIRCLPPERRLKHDATPTML